MGGETAAGKLQKPAQDTKSWVVTGTKGMFAYPAGQETIETGADSWSSAAEIDTGEAAEDGFAALSRSFSRYTSAIRSISTSAPRGSSATATVDLAGVALPRCSA